MEEEKKDLDKINEVVVKINKLLKDEGDYALVPTLTIVGNQIAQSVQVVKRPQESKIIKPEGLIK